MKDCPCDEAAKLETLARIAEKTGRLNEEEVRLLFPSAPAFQHSEWLESPFGLGTAALCALAVLATKWARVWRARISAQTAEIHSSLEVVAAA